MPNDLVVQLGAKLDQFQSDMKQAGDIADSAVLNQLDQSGCIVSAHTFVHPKRWGDGIPRNGRAIELHRYCG